MKKTKQQQLFKPSPSAHGGSLKHSQKTKRPLSTVHSMHLVLRSSHAKGPWSFKKYQKQIDLILHTFAAKYGIQILSYANVGNHIHLHIKLFKRRLYAPFIRAVTAAIMMKVTGFCKWRPKAKELKFWDFRPFSRIAATIKEFKALIDYIQINHLEGLGVSREDAKEQTKWLRQKFESS
jgi:hypothetical protein